MIAISYEADKFVGRLECPSGSIKIIEDFENLSMEGTVEWDKYDFEYLRCFMIGHIRKKPKHILQFCIINRWYLLLNFILGF